MQLLPVVLLSGILLASGCASFTSSPSSTAAAAASPGSCEVGEVPRGAVFGVRQGMDIATWPPEVSRGASACQRVWYGQRQRPEAMQVLATYYYEYGRVRRLSGRVPGGPAYDCHYSDGALDTARSRDPAQCPKASEIERAP
jgi:hypothetical protein